MKKNAIVISTGFALFSMFFGSGNLVFPIVVGQQSEGHYLLAALGILLTGVLVPFLGVLGMMLYNGSTQGFFHNFGKIGTFIFSLCALALMGPFGVLARCLTVAHGALQLIIPGVPLALTSFLICVAIYFLTVNKNKIVPALGVILTPLLLLSIAAIAFFALKGSSLPTTANADAWAPFKNGFFQGYQTMDLLAAFFFSTFVINHLRGTLSQQSQEGSSLKIFLKSSLIGGGILSAVYFILVMLGSMYAPSLAHIRPQEMLGHIAVSALGSMAAPCVCVAVVLACLTTAIVLASLFADFLHKEVSLGKIGNKQSLVITLLIGFMVSTLEFAGIARFLGPILEIIYPALIMLTIVNIAHKLWGVKSSHWPVTLTFAAKLCFL
jgi:branched-chain amino acid:cation transporter, LIVCS family